MDVFDLRRSLVEEYASFARSFTTIRAPDIRAQIEAEYDRGRFWPDPLIQINPRFKQGRAVRDLVEDGLLCPEMAELFSIRLYEHQEIAISPDRHDSESAGASQVAGSRVSG